VTGFREGAPKDAAPRDRLYEIGMKGTAQATVADTTWLFQQVSRLREKEAALLAETERLREALWGIKAKVAPYLTRPHRPSEYDEALVEVYEKAARALRASEEGQ
jgi:hypothetical protein